MKTLKRIILFLAITFAVLFLNANYSNAATTTVSSEDDLINAINDAQEGDIIQLTTSIELTKPLEITDRKITIDGNGNTVTYNKEDWTTTSANETLITVGGTNAKVTLTNMTLKDSPKYGAQAYNGGYLVLNGVTVTNCKYGGVMANGGTIEVVDLVLNRNGEKGNNGIEIAKGSGVDDDNIPTLIMNGKLSSTEKDNVIYLAENDELLDFELQNTEDTVYKVLASGNKVIVTDENNNIVFTSNENEKVNVEGDTFVPNVILTVNVKEQNIPITLLQGSVITKEELAQRINLAELGLSNYTLDGFYSDINYTTEFNFTNPITTDTTIYAKVTENAQPAPQAPTQNNDETPPTGVQSYLSVATAIIALFIIATVNLKKKEEKTF